MKPLNPRIQLAIASRGFILVVSLLLSLVLLTMGLSAALLSMTNISVSRNARENAITRYRAEGGMDAMIAFIRDFVLENDGEFPELVDLPVITAPIGVDGAATAMTFTGYDTAGSQYRYQLLGADDDTIDDSVRMSVAARDPLLNSEYVANAVVSVITERFGYGIYSEGSVNVTSTASSFDSNVYIGGNGAGNPIGYLAGTIARGAVINYPDTLSDSTLIQCNGTSWNLSCANTTNNPGTLSGDNAVEPPTLSLPNISQLALADVQQRLNGIATVNALSDIGTAVGTGTAAVLNEMGCSSNRPTNIATTNVGGTYRVYTANAQGGFYDCNDGNPASSRSILVENSILRYTGSNAVRFGDNNNGRLDTVTFRNSVVVMDSTSSLEWSNANVILENSSIYLIGTAGSSQQFNDNALTGASVTYIGDNLIASNALMNFNNAVTTSDASCGSDNKLSIIYGGNNTGNGIRFQANAANNIHGALMSNTDVIVASGSLNITGSLATRNAFNANSNPVVSSYCDVTEGETSGVYAIDTFADAVLSLTSINAELLVLSRN